MEVTKRTVTNIRRSNLNICSLVWPLLLWIWNFFIPDRIPMIVSSCYAEEVSLCATTLASQNRNGAMVRQQKTFQVTLGIHFSNRFLSFALPNSIQAKSIVTMDRMKRNAMVPAAPTECTKSAIFSHTNEHWIRPVFLCSGTCRAMKRNPSNIYHPFPNPVRTIGPITRLGLKIPNSVSPISPPTPHTISPCTFDSRAVIMSIHHIWVLMWRQLKECQRNHWM